MEDGGYNYAGVCVCVCCSYKNGSKTRELFRDRHTNNNSWKASCTVSALKKSCANFLFRSLIICWTRLKQGTVEILGSTLQSQRSLPQQAQGSTGGTGVELQSQSSLQRWSCGLWWRVSSWQSGCMPRDWVTLSLTPPGSLQLEEPRGTQLFCRQAHSPHNCQ